MWLDAIRFTPPFTIADASALRDQIHTALPGSVVDVYTTRWTEVYARVGYQGICIERTFPIVD